jgi:membrane-associated phospholipid phosphatase
VFGDRRSARTLDIGAIGASRVARGGFAWVAAGGLSAWLQRDRGIFFETAASTWLAAGTARGASHLIGRQRPCSVSRKGTLISCPESPSLPSEHAAAAVAAALTLARVNPRLRPVLAAAAAAVAVSRVRVGVHYPSDVVAGALLGGLVSHAIRPLFEPLDD